MSTMKKTDHSHENNNNRRFPPEAYDYHDDVTKEAVDRIREKARPELDRDEWEVVDGFGRPPR